MWVLSCSRVGLSKHMCWVYGYKVVYDFVEEDDVVLIRIFSKVDQLSVCNISVTELVL